MEIDIVHPAVGMVDIDGFGSHIEVAEPDHRLCRVEIDLEIFANPGKPLELKSILLRSDRVALRNIGIDDRYSGYFCSEDTGVFVVGPSWSPWITLVGARRLRVRHAVVAFHAAKNGVVSGVAKCIRGKLFVLNFRLLQTHDIRFMFGNPIEHQGLPAANGVDIVCGDLHGGLLPVSRH